MKCGKLETQKFFEVKKCCFCVPIREGVLTFGYINLVICILSLPLVILLVVAQQNVAQEPDEENNLLVDVHIRWPLAIVVLILDIIIIVILLVGAHKKKRNLLRIYFYSGVLLQVLSLIVDLIYFDYTAYVLNTLYVIGLGINIYLLYLVYCLIHSMKENRDVQYIPHIENQPI